MDSKPRPIASGETRGGELTRFERLALSVGRLTNERDWAKRLQYLFVRSASYAWIAPTMGPRMYVDGVEPLVDPPSDRGVVFACNHRTYFDAYLYMLALYSAGARWPTKLYFPVRANFFYESPLGIAMNLAIGGGVMYPPIFRDKKKTAHNSDALDRIARFLGQPGTAVGLHPEGTRNKSDDPYALLPAQPGIGQIVLRSRPLVIPVFINGPTNDFVKSVRESYRPGARRDNPCIVTFGAPVDYDDLTTSKPRAALYKRCADRILEGVAACGEREKELRASCGRGEISDDDPHWLDNIARQRRLRGVPFL